MHFSILTTLITTLILLPLSSFSLPQQGQNTVDQSSSSSSSSINQSPANDNGITNSGGNHDQHHHHCANLPTRDPNTCQCLPGFVEPGGHHHDGEGFDWWHRNENCQCPDPANAKLKITRTNQAKTAACVCHKRHQIYSTEKGRCVCQPGYKGHYTFGGVLHCKATTTTSSSVASTSTVNPSGGVINHKRLFEQAIKKRQAIEAAKHALAGPTQTSTSDYVSQSLFYNPYPTLTAVLPSSTMGVGIPSAIQIPVSLLPQVEEDEDVADSDSGSDSDSDFEEMELEEIKASDVVGDLEIFLGCSNGEKACDLDGKWTCTDIMSTLATCGGCPGDAIDCADLPGVSEVRCESGQCIIDSCQRGFDLTNSTSCLPKVTKSWFLIQ